MAGAIQLLETGLKRLQVSERLVRRNPLYYGSIQREFESLQATGLRERAERTELRLQEIQTIAGHTRYGRALGLPKAGRVWPLLHKDTVRDDPTAFHAGRSWFTSRANTGGTTGTPLRLVRSPASVVAEQVCIDLMVSLAGVDPLHARIAVLRGDNVKSPSDMQPPFWIHAMGGRRLILSSNHLSDATLDHYIKALTDFAPDLLWVYPSTLESLCRSLLRAGQRLHIPRVLSSSEMLADSAWPLAKLVLGASIVDYYGQAERVAFAYATRAGEYIFLPGYASVELLPAYQDESGYCYEIIGTSLWNTAMPLVRYRTGDLIRLPQSPTQQALLEISHGLRSFPGVIGRSADVLLAPDGRGVLTGIDHIPRGIHSLLRLQVIQETPHKVELRALVTEDFTEQDAAQLLRNARLKIPESVDVQWVKVEQLQRTANGKTPFVIHSPEVKEALQTAGITGTRASHA
ncbi:MAG: hypothetical protein ACJ8MR_11615 [Povalibacter sp.]